MKIMVTAKRVVDPYVRIRVRPDGTGVETQDLKMTMNPFDEIALEEAIRLKEKGQIKEVVLVSIGTAASQETLRYGLALGADRAILIETNVRHDPLNIATILQKMVLMESPQLVLMGKQSIDGDNNQTPQMLAGLLDWPQATYASTLQLNQDEAVVVREVDGGLETIAVMLPAVISVDLRLNTPRYASLPNIMQAKRKPLQVLSLSELKLTLPVYQQVLGTQQPLKRQPGVKVQSVEELVDKLRHEVNVIEG